MIEENSAKEEHEVIKMLKTKSKLSQEDVTQKLDNLTKNISKDLEAIKVWDEIKFVDLSSHIGTIFQYSNCYQTKYLSLSVIRSQIKYNWISLQNEEIAQHTKKITTILEQEIGRYEGVLDKEKEDILKVFSSILSDIAKLSNQLQSFLPSLLQKSMENQIFCQAVMRLLVFLVEDLIDKEESLEEQKHGITNEILNIKDSILQLAFHTLDRYNENKESVKKDLCQNALEVIFLYTSFTKSMFPAERTNFLLGFLKEPVFRDYVLNCFSRFFEENSNVKKYHVIEEIIKEVQIQIPSDIDVLSEQSIIQKDFADQEDNFVKMCVSVNQLFLTYATSTISIPALNVVDYYNTDKQFKSIFSGVLNYLQRLTPLEQVQLENIEFWIKFLSQIKDTTYDSSDLLNDIEEILINLAYHLVSYFSRPSTCRVEISHSGEPTVEYQVSNDETLYQQKKILLHLLLHFKFEQLHQIFIQKFEKLIDGSEWNYTNIENLQYALGAVVGGLDHVKEKSFCMSTIKSYMNLIETRRNKLAKVVIIGSLLHVTSQFKDFLYGNKNILETMVTKIVEFFQDDNPAIQDLAAYYFKLYCEQFYDFFTTEMKNGEIKFKSLVNKSKFIIKQLHFKNKLKFYEGLVSIVSKCSMLENKEQYFNLLMQPLYKDLEKYFEKHEAILDRVNYIEIRLILEIIASASSPFADLFLTSFQYDSLYQLKLYLDQKIDLPSKRQKLDEEMISLICQLRELAVTIMSNSLKPMTKKDEMLSEEVQKHGNALVVISKKLIAQFQGLNEEFKDYSTITIIEQCIQMAKKDDDVIELSKIFFDTCVTICSKQQDNPQYDQHILRSYSLLKTYSSLYPQILTDQIQSQAQNNSSQIIIFIFNGISSTDKDIYIPSLQTLNEVIKVVNSDSEKTKLFYQKHLYDILKSIFQAAIDGYHVLGLSLLTDILIQVFSIIQKIKPSSNQKSVNKKQKENIISSYILQKIAEMIPSKEIVEYIQSKKLIEDLISSWDKDFKATFQTFLEILEGN